MAQDEKKNVSEINDKDAEKVSGGNVYLNTYWECQDCYYSSVGTFSVCPKCGSTNIKTGTGF